MQPALPFNPDDWIVAASQESEILESEQWSAVLGAIERCLSFRERWILALRYGLFGQQDHTLKEVGERFGLSGERTRQLEAKALWKLHEALVGKKRQILFQSKKVIISEVHKSRIQKDLEIEHRSEAMDAARKARAQFVERIQRERAELQRKRRHYHPRCHVVFDFQLDRVGIEYRHRAGIECKGPKDHTRRMTFSWKPWVRKEDYVEDVFQSMIRLGLPDIPLADLRQAFKDVLTHCGMGQDESKCFDRAEAVHICATYFPPGFIAPQSPERIAAKEKRAARVEEARARKKRREQEVRESWRKWKIPQIREKWRRRALAQ